MIGLSVEKTVVKVKIKMHLPTPRIAAAGLPFLVFFSKTVCRHISIFVAVNALLASLFGCVSAPGNENSDNVVKITGIVKKTSSFPSPQGSSYPDCFYTVLLENRGADGKIAEYSVLLKCFENYHLIPDNIVKPGEALFIEAIPFDDLPEREQAIQRTDEIERFDLECYVARKLSRNLPPEKNISPDATVDGRKRPLRSSRRPRYPRK